MAQANQELGRLNDSLTASNLALQRRSGYFEALATMNSQLSPEAAIGDVCLAAANAVRAALDAEAVLVCTNSDEQHCCHVALGDGQKDRLEVFDTTAAAGLNPPEQPAVSCLTPAGPHADSLLTRLGERLGPGPYWLLRALSHGRAIAYAVFSGPREKIQQHSAESHDLTALSAAIGLAIANARVRADSHRLAEDLAQTNQQLQQAQAQVLRSRSLQAIAEMAAGAAHELNNPLAVISGRAQQLRGQSDDPQITNLLNAIIEHAHSCSQIVTDLMDFARPQPPQTQPVELAPLLEPICSEFVERHAGIDRDRVELAIPPGLPPAQVDPDHLRQIIRELLQNAGQSARPDQLRLAVNCRLDLSDNSIVIAVEDNGCGMTPVVLQKAFDPFFSHLPAGRRRGLGLARAQRLAESNAANLWLESQSGAGTTAYLRLPAITPARPERHGEE
jgi:signal transduction histidine kinase